MVRIDLIYGTLFPAGQTLFFTQGFFAQLAKLVCTE